MQIISTKFQLHLYISIKEKVTKILININKRFRVYMKHRNILPFSPLKFCAHKLNDLHQH